MTHGLRSRPRSTAFFASRPAPTITDGLEVLVQEVIEAITTAPWSISTSWPSSETVTFLEGRPLSWCGVCGPAVSRRSPLVAGGSEAGKVSTTPSSTSCSSCWA